MTAQEILELNRAAHDLLAIMIKEEFNKGNILTETEASNSYLRFDYLDGTLIELVVERNIQRFVEPNNYRPTRCVINHYKQNHRISTNSFPIYDLLLDR